MNHLFKNYLTFTFHLNSKIRQEQCKRVSIIGKQMNFGEVCTYISNFHFHMIVVRLSEFNFQFRKVLWSVFDITR
jgi:hypothetical protein